MYKWSHIHRDRPKMLNTLLNREPLMLKLIQLHKHKWTCLRVHGPKKHSLLNRDPQMLKLIQLHKHKWTCLRVHGPKKHSLLNINPLMLKLIQLRKHKWTCLRVDLFTPLLPVSQLMFRLLCQCGSRKWSNGFILGTEVGQRPQMLIFRQLFLNCQCVHMKWSHGFIPGTEVETLDAIILRQLSFVAT